MPLLEINKVNIFPAPTAPVLTYLSFKVSFYI